MQEELINSQGYPKEFWRKIGKIGVGNKRQNNIGKIGVGNKCQNNIPMKIT